MRVHSKLSASCLAFAMVLGSMWWSAASTYVVLHDDARLVGVLAKTLDQPAVRRSRCLSPWSQASWRSVWVGCRSPCCAARVRVEPGISLKLVPILDRFAVSEQVSDKTRYVD